TVGAYRVSTATAKERPWRRVRAIELASCMSGYSQDIQLGSLRVGRRSLLGMREAHRLDQVKVRPQLLQQFQDRLVELLRLPGLDAAVQRRLRVPGPRLARGQLQPRHFTGMDEFGPR